MLREKFDKKPMIRRTLLLASLDDTRFLKGQGNGLEYAVLAPEGECGSAYIDDIRGPYKTAIGLTKGVQNTRDIFQIERKVCH